MVVASGGPSRNRRSSLGPRPRDDPAQRLSGPLSGRHPVHALGLLDPRTPHPGPRCSRSPELIEGQGGQSQPTVAFPPSTKFLECSASLPRQQKGSDELQQVACGVDALTRDVSPVATRTPSSISRPYLSMPAAVPFMQRA